MSPALLLLGALAGAGATIVIDLWAQLLRLAFHVPSLNLCLLGRWVLHMPHGTFAHPSIARAQPRTGECVAGWVAHYLIGLSLGVGFVLLAPAAWWERPSLWLPLAFGILTVAMPFFVMQPALGLGVASARTPHPTAARLKSLGTHTVYGLGLYLAIRLLAPLLLHAA